MRPALLPLPFTLGTVPVLGVWMFWIIPTPLPLYPNGKAMVARPASARLEDRRPRHSGAARALYQARCVRCHESDGKARSLHETNPHAPDFTDPHWQQNRSAHQLVVSILDGRGTQMPAFGGKLTTAQARDLVGYIRSFAPTSPTSVETSPEDFETRFRELDEEYQRLREQLDELRARRKQ
jgi:mono/diheme cytochrome c family protein